MQKIPVTILTGFLGAGKTTLLNHLIEQYPDKKFAIIENEFGDIGIDQELVVDVDEGIFEMSNGCICCTLNHELVDTLHKLVNSEKKFDHLLVETTGMAEPDGIAAAFVTDPAIQQVFQLNATICLVDAQHAIESFEELEEARRQVTFADYFLINKQSETEEAALLQLEAKLREMNPFAEMERVDFGQTQTDILHLQAYDIEKVSHKVAHSHHEAHDHLTGVAAQSFTFDAPFDFLTFIHWTKVLLMVQGKNIYRIKGIFHFKDHPERMIFQSVKTSSAFQKGAAWEEGEKRQSKVVFIGKGLKRKPVERALQSCLAKT